MSHSLHPGDCTHEYRALLQLYADTQTRCSAHICAQQTHIQRLSAEVLQLRARALVRATALDWARQDLQMLHTQVQSLQAMLSPLATSASTARPRSASDLPAFSARATEMLIRQTGCVEHNGHWRQDDHCKRTGQTCVLALQPDALEMLHPRHAAEDAPFATPALPADIATLPQPT